MQLLVKFHCGLGVCGWVVASLLQVSLAPGSWGQGEAWDREKLGTCKGARIKGARIETRGGRQSGTRGGIKWGCPGVA